MYGVQKKEMEQIDWQEEKEKRTAGPEMRDSNKMNFCDKDKECV